MITTKAEVWRAVALVLAVLCLVLGTQLLSRPSDDARREACRQRNAQHELQSAMTGGRYTWIPEDCH